MTEERGVVRVLQLSALADGGAGLDSLFSFIFKWQDVKVEQYQQASRSFAKPLYLLGNGHGDVRVETVLQQAGDVPLPDGSLPRSVFSRECRRVEVQRHKAPPFCLIYIFSVAALPNHC